jgi:hypothetical protein
MEQYVPCQSCSRSVNRFLEVCPYCAADPGGDRRDRPPAPAPQPNSRQRYRPLQSIALFLQLLFALYIVGSAAIVLTGLEYRSALLDLDAGRFISFEDAVATEDRYIAAAGVAGLANIVLAVTFLVWFWRAYSNLSALNRPRKRRAGWAIGSWFIPIGNLFLPYGIGAEIWREGRLEADSPLGSQDPNLEPVISWWALFLLMGLVNQVAFFTAADQEDGAAELAASVGVELVGTAVGIAAAVAAVRFVRRATERQEALARATLPAFPPRPWQPPSGPV